MEDMSRVTIEHCSYGMHHKVTMRSDESDKLGPILGACLQVELGRPMLILAKAVDHIDEMDGDDVLEVEESMFIEAARRVIAKYKEIDDELDAAVIRSRRSE